MGWGEALLDDPADEAVLEALFDDLVATGLPPAPALVGRAGPGGRAFRAALDGARLDLLAQGPEARAAGRPVIGVNALIGATDAASTVEAARAAADAGFRTLKLKVAAAETAASLAERVGAVRSAVGAGIALRVDANGTWDVAGAEERLAALEPFGLQYVEQPLAPGDFEGAASLRARVGRRARGGRGVRLGGRRAGGARRRRRRRAGRQAGPGRRAGGGRGDRAPTRRSRACRS